MVVAATLTAGTAANAASSPFFPPTSKSNPLVPAGEEYGRLVGLLAGGGGGGGGPPSSGGGSSRGARGVGRGGRRGLLWPTPYGAVGGGGGGAATTIGTAVVDPPSSTNPPPPISIVGTIALDDGGGGKIIDGRRNNIVASVVSMVVVQSLNVACAALVVSGTFGACVASWMITEIRARFLPTMMAATLPSASPRYSWIDNEYRWTALATLGSLLLLSSSPRLRSFSIDDVSFVAILWAYSRIVDPTLGGAIGIAHVALGMASAVLGNPKIGNAIGRLGDARYGKLEDDEEGSTSYVDPTRHERRSRAPVVLASGTGSAIASGIASGMGSASLLAVSPRHSLGLYMLGSTLASMFSSSLEGGGVGGGGRGGRAAALWRPIGGWARWWLLGEEGGTTTSDGSSGLGGGAAVVVAAAAAWLDGGDGGGSVMGALAPPRWGRSGRLLALYWTIAITKAAAAYTLM